MSLTRRTLACLSLGALAAPRLACAQANGSAPSVVELFTSQGCSSCPPADALMLELTKDRNFIPLTYAVEIWDYLGWKDTLARPAFTRRQKAYAEMVAGKRVYTPQAIINGRMHCVGSDFSSIARLRAATPARGVKLALQASGDGWRASGNLPPTLDATGRLILLPFRSRETVQIGRGENSGRAITYANVVRDIIDLGVLEGGEFETRISRKDVAVDRADGFALLMQAGSIEMPGVVLAGAMVDPAGIRV
ncbi:MAG: DUF1223 domain-containing protein [Proteobacteria bacterium]|nr:DUF1223 domain-containing protein [Pseudomonadota bacterium]